MNFRKSLLLFILLSLFTVNNIFANDFYWVGNSGNWNDPVHWAKSSGGDGGIGIPTLSDNVFLDRNSFSSIGAIVTINSDIAIHDLTIEENNLDFTLNSNSNTRIDIYGSIDVKGGFSNEIESSIYFKGNRNKVYEMYFGWFKWKANFYFEGTGTYLFKSPLQAHNNSVTLTKGTIDLNGFDVLCASFSSISNQKRKLISKGSTILAYKSWITNQTKFNYDFSQTRIYVITAAVNAVDKGGDTYLIKQSRKSRNNKTISNPVLNSDTVSCGNNCDGSLTISFTTDCANGFVDWLPGPNADNYTGECFSCPVAGPTVSNTITDLCPGIYTAVISNDCDADIQAPQAEVSGHPSIVPLAQIVTPTDCNGMCNGSTNVIVSGAPYAVFSYLWLTGNPLDTNRSLSNLCAGPYDLEVKDGFGCIDTFNLIVTQPDSMYANVTVMNPSCFGDCSGIATSNPIGGTAPYFYSWAPPTGNPAVDTVQTFLNLCDGVPYTVTVTDANGCLNDTTITPVQPPQMQIDTIVQHISCGGFSDGQVTVTVLSGGVPPYTHNWSNGQVDVGAVSILSGLSAGTYTDTIRDANGCENILTFNIIEPSILSTLTTTTNLTCNGICDGTATATLSGGAGGYNYTWSAVPPQGPISGQGTDSIFNLCPAQYIVDVVDANGCPASDTIIISEPLPITVNPTSVDVSCPGFNDGTATVNPTGGTGNPAVDFTYSWTGPACSAAPYNTQSIASLCPGTYIVVATDSAGCTAIDSIIITEPNPVNLTMTVTDETCFNVCDGTAEVSVTGGTTPYTYLWTSVPAGQVTSGQGTDSIFNLCAGNYTANITDSTGCTTNGTVTVNAQTAILGNLVTSDLSCNGICNGTATVSPTGGIGPYTVSWNGAASINIPMGGSNTITALCAVAHTALITDANNCTLLINFNINQPPPLTTSTTTMDVSCFGLCDGSAITTPIGGTAPYTPIIWTPLMPAGPSFPDPAINLCAGTYYVEVTDDSLCTVNDTITIFEPLEIFPNAQFTDITCNGLNDGTAVSLPAGGVPGYTFNWTGPACSAAPYSTQSINALCGGQYIVTVTDTNGCTGLDTVLITDPLLLTVNANATAASCGTVCDGTALATPTGGTPGYTYVWTDPLGQTNQTATGLCAGTYTVTATDTNGCTAQDTTVIQNLIVIGINTSAVGISCNGVCDGTATAVPSGGALPYSYQWSGNTTGPNDTLATVGGLCPGMIYVTVTDANGCVSTDSINMPIDPPVLTPNGKIDQPISCNGACDAMVSHAPTGGTPPYVSVWSLPFGIDTNNVCPTFAVITVTDANNCVQSDTLVILDPAPVIPNDVVVDVLCNGDTTGSITLSPTGGAGGTYTYVWIPNVSTGSSAVNLAAGVYQITVTDSNGCQVFVTDTINEPPVLSSIPIGIDVSCNGLCDGIAAVVANGGTGGTYTYSWAPNGQTTDSIFNLCAPNLSNTVTVTDSNGCISSQTITIQEPAVLNANVTGTPIGCTSMCNGTALSTPTGGTPPYTYSWNPTGSTNSGITGLCIGNYMITVTDTNGCVDTASYTVTTPPLLTVTLDSTNVSCNGNDDGIARAIITGGTPPYAFSWVGGCLPGPDTNAIIMGLCPGVYTVTVTDASSCIFIGSVIITEPLPISGNEVVVGANCGVCDGSITMFPSGGTPPYSHSWNTGNPADTNTALTGLCAGFYTNTMTDAQGCVTTFTIAITNPVGPSGITGTVNDATCSGICDGSLNAIPIGGVAPFTYAWASNPMGGPYPNDSTLTNLCAGTYNLTLTEVSTGCILTTSLVVGEADSITANPTFTNTTCSGVCDGIASVTPTGGTPPYNFVWSHNGSTASSVAGLCVGSVSVTITDFFGCTNTVNFNITSPNVLTVNSSVVDATCNGVCDGSATANLSGGTGPYTYQWDDPLAQTSQTATSLCAGTYIVSISDFNGCSGSDTVVINDPVLIIPNTVATNSTCGNSDGTASVCASSGGTGTHTYFWPGLGSTSCNVAGLSAGTYTVEITDINGCMQPFLVVISDVNGPSVMVNTTNASCNGICDGQATATVTSGTPTYSYLWQTGSQTTQTVTGLCAGNYSVEVTDGNNCVTVNPVTISENIAITAAVTTIDVTCNGASDGSALVIPNGGIPPYVYSWTGGNAAGQTINAVGGLTAGNYTVTITDFIGCSFIQNITINEPNVLTISTTGIAANCNGACDGQATATPSGGTAPYSYLWSTGLTTPTITSLCAGTYTVTVTDLNGCVGNSTVTIGDGITITATINTVDATCGSCDGSATANAAGGSGGPYAYLWSPGGQTTTTLNNLCPGAYNLDVTDNTGCIQSFNVLINNPSGPTLTTLADSVSCFGSCDGLTHTTVTAGNPNYIFQWDDPLLQTNDSATALCSGLYNIVVQDSLGCITVDSVTVPEPLQIISNLTGTNPTCPTNCDGTATVTPIAGIGSYTVSWDGAPAITIAVGGSNTITGLCAGTHTALITDQNNCTILDSIMLSDPTNISITISSTPVTCMGSCDGTALANASGGTPGYQYSWNTTPIQNNSLATALCAGIYIVTVTDNSNCTDTASVIVIDPPVLTTASIQTPISCNGICDGSITTVPAGGVGPYTYIWGNGDTTQTTSNLCAGIYDVIVIDVNNCTTYDTTTLASPAILNDSTMVTGASCGICNGSAISTPVGGIGPFDFVWTDPMTPSIPLQTDLGVTTSSIVGLCAGTLNLQITDQGTGCTYNYTIIINSTTGPTITLTSTDETCVSSCDGTATVTPTGGTPPYTYSWIPTGPPTITNQTATNLCIGTYTISVTDSLNCITSDTISINTTGLNLTVTSIVPETCFGDCDGSATVLASAGTPNYTYLWSPTSQTTPMASNLCVGSYIATVTDNASCSDSISANVTGPDLLVVTASINTPVSCFGTCDGIAIANVLGGTLNYTYAWNDPANQTTQIASNLCAGTYIVIVTDNNGCTTQDTIIITEPTAILANETLVEPACGVCDGSIAVSPSGGFGPYTFLWTTPTAPPNPQPVTATLINLCAGAYTLTITDSTGCMVNFNFPLSNVNAPIPNTTTTDVSCNGICDGQITSAPTGGIPPYTYFWSPTGNTSQSITGLCAGPYTLNVTDDVGCIGIAFDTITQPDALQANINASNILCNGVCDGWVVSNTIGGTSPYAYNWTSIPAGQVTTGQSTDSISSLCSGTYIVSVTDSNNCPVAIDSVTISEPTLITVISTKIDATCTSNCDGSATVTPSGGTGPYAFEWNGNTTPGQSGTQMGLCVGLNTIVIIDQNNCSITDSINIGATDTVLANAGSDQTVCLGTVSANLNGISGGTFTNVEWFELPGMISLGTIDSITTTLPSTAGVFCYVFQVTGACVVTDTTCVTIEPLPLADAGPDVNVFINGSTTLNASGGVAYSWTPTAELSDSNIFNPVASPSETTTYYVTVTSASGCSAIDSVVVTVLPEIKFPDGITPNGDGSNDVWVIDFVEQFPNNVVEIYNRWGELLFHADGYLQDWDGTYQGKELPIGTYYYIIDLHEESIKPFTGPITILR